MAGIQSIEVELEAITPLWIGGEQASGAASPGVPGVHAVLVPVLAGGVLGEELKNLADAESAVFGSTSRSSSVVVRLQGTPRIAASVAGESDQLPGLAYMFWSVFQQKRNAILPGERFRLRPEYTPLSIHPRRGRGTNPGDD